MPSCRVTNQTSKPLNICLKQVTALHFENSVQPGQTIKFRPGKVWFTLEALVDDGTKKSRYSLLKSAATIALLSVAVGAVAATAGAALLPEVGVAGVAAAATAAGGYLMKGMAVTKTALVTNSGTIAKMSSVVLPKAIDKLTAEVGGLTALQREVLTIISSPTISSDVRHKATGLLKQLHTAYTKDKTEKQAKQAETAALGSASAGTSKSATVKSTSTDVPDPSVTLGPIDERQGEKLEAELEAGKLDDRVEHQDIRTGEMLRVHGIYMNKRREFEVRVGTDGHLELWDVKERKRWGS